MASLVDDLLSFLVAKNSSMLIVFAENYEEILQGNGKTLPIFRAKIMFRVQYAGKYNVSVTNDVVNF